MLGMPHLREMNLPYLLKHLNIYYKMSFALDFGELVKRALKYFVEGIIVALAAFVIPSKRLKHL